MRFFAIRHPPTEWNMQHIAQGHADSPLTEEGRTHALALGRALATRKIARIHSSDLGRCEETTELVNRSLNRPVTYAEQLREQNLGIFNGVKRTTIAAAVGGRLEDETFVPQGGESLQSVQKRVHSYLRSIEESPNLIVTHTGCVESLLAAAYDRSIGDERTRTSHLTIVEFELHAGQLTELNRETIDPKSV